MTNVFSLPISKIAEKTTVKIDGINEGSGVIVKRNGNRYTVITAWHVIKDNLPSEELNITTFDGTINNWESMNLKRIQNLRTTAIHIVSCRH